MENEPLEQKIELTKPPTYFLSTQQPQHAEWKCAVANKKAAIGLMKRPLAERDKKHAITTKGQDSPLPLPAIPTTPTFDDLVYAKRATFKTTSAQREDDPLPDGCTYSNDGNPNCNVSVTDNTVPGFVEASDGNSLTPDSRLPPSSDEDKLEEAKKEMLERLKMKNA